MITVKEIAKKLNCKIVGDEDLIVETISTIKHSSKSELALFLDDNTLEEIEKCEAQAILIFNIFPKLPTGKTYILSSINIHKLYPRIANIFNKPRLPMTKQIEDSAIIEDSAVISFNSYIGHNTKIGKNTIIYPNVSILNDVTIGDNCIIYSGVNIRENTIIGDNCVIHQGASIGGEGFHYSTEDKVHYRIKQFGFVKIGNNVDIGCNATVDKCVLGKTIIKDGSKIDNLCIIAHDVEIGENFLCSGQTGIAGGTTIGNNVTAMGQVGIGGYIEIADDVYIAGKSFVTSSVLEEEKKVAGNCGLSLYEELKCKSLYKKLPRIYNEINGK